MDDREHKTSMSIIEEKKTEDFLLEHWEDSLLLIKMRVKMIIHKTDHDSKEAITIILSLLIVEPARSTQPGNQQQNHLLISANKSHLSRKEVPPS